MAETWALGIEIGGTKLQLGIGPGSGPMAALERLRVDPGRSATGILEQIQESYPKLLRHAGLDLGQVRAAGIGFGGPVEDGPGRVHRSYQVPGWDDFPLSDWIREHLEIPVVVVQNDADAAGLAEARFGAGRGVSPLLYVTVGSGIGGALILNDQVYRGFGKGAGEIGHLRVPDASTPGAGWVELEQRASGWAIAAAARAHAQGRIARPGQDWVVLDRAGGDPDQITAVLVAQAEREGDSASSAILARARSALAFALVQTISMLAPRRIILGGGVSLIGEPGWLEPIRSLVQRDVLPVFRDGFDIVPASLGEEVVVHGALALAHEAFAASPC